MTDDDAMSEKPARGFFGYQAELEPKVFEFQREAYPDRDPAGIADQWRWMFVQSAGRQGREPSVWLYLKQGRVVAHQGAIPVRLQVAGQELETGWFVETMAAESVRGSPIGPMLIKKALEDMPLSLSLGQTEQMRQLQFALGWKYVGSLTKYVLVCGYRMNLRNKLPPLLAQAAAAALGIRDGFRWRSRWRRARRVFEARRLERFTDRHDGLWRRMAATCRCLTVRDASYLNWKYVDRPARQFECWDIEAGGELRGTVVAMTAEANDVYPYRRGFLVDFLVPLDEPEAISALIACGVGVLKRAGAQTVACQVASPAVAAALAAFGFAARNERHQFLLAMEGADESMAREMSEAANWFLTLGDSDADRYPD